MIMKDRRDYMFTLVRQWRESGLTQKEFCLQHGITLSKFSYWISRWKEAQPSGEGRVIPMGSPGSTAHGVLSVVFANGVRLEVPSADMGLSARLIAVGCCLRWVPLAAIMRFAVSARPSTYFLIN